MRVAQSPAVATAPRQPAPPLWDKPPFEGSRATPRFAGRPIECLVWEVVDEALREKIFKNMSERAQELLKEEIQYMGPVRLKEVEAAQARIVDIVKQLEESGEVMIAGRGGSEDIFV